MYQAMKCSAEGMKEIWQFEYIKENNQRFFFVMIIAAIWYALLISHFYLVIKPSMPETAAEQYIRHLQNREYEKAIEYFTAIPPGKGTGYDYIRSVLKNKYDGTGDIRIKSAEKSSEIGIYKILIEVKKDGAGFEDSIYLRNTGSTLYGIKKEWRVVFPFKTRDINITGTDGAVVLIDGIESGEIRGGKLTVSQVIHGLHNFEVQLYSIAKSENMDFQIDEGSEPLELKVVLYEDFRKGIDKLVSDFIKGWSDYCLTQSQDKVKPYLTDRLYKEYAKDSDRFSGSKYVTSECVIGQGEIEIGSKNTVFYTVDEKWHLKEIITSSELVFKDNYKSQLEQTQYIKSRYQIINDRGTWKIDSAKQLDFKQEIKK